MAIDTDYAHQMAMQLATYEVQGTQTRLQRSQSNYQAQRDALNSLRSALSTFASSVRGLKTGGAGMLVNRATFSAEGYATATVGTNAAEGRYQFYVKQLASAHQVALEGLTPEKIGTAGTLTLTQGGESFTIDLAAIDSDGDDSNSLEELAKAINGHADNTGVRASLVRADGQVLLVLSAEQSGEDAAIGVSVSGTNADFAAAVAARRELSAARNAEVYLGGQDGIKLTSASNRFDNIIDGVSLTFTKAHESPDQTLTIEISRDESATKGKAQSFIDAFNTLMTTIDKLTASGGETSSRGTLAGDSTVSTLENRLNQLLRTSFGGVSLIDFGISADRNGKLTIDTARFEKALAANPEGFEKLFTGKDNLIDSLDKLLTSYTSSADGLLKNRIDSLDMSLKRVREQSDALQLQYESYYNRYLRQYTTMLQTMEAMQQTLSMFG